MSCIETVPVSLLRAITGYDFRPAGLCSARRPLWTRWWVVFATDGLFPIHLLCIVLEYLRQPHIEVKSTEQNDDMSRFLPMEDRLR